MNSLKQVNIAITPQLQIDADIAIAATRAGAVGLLDLGPGADTDITRYQLERLAGAAGAGGRWGLRVELAAVDKRTLEQQQARMAASPQVLLLAGLGKRQLRKAAEAFTRKGTVLLAEVTSIDTALAAGKAGFDGVVLKGNEAGGLVSPQAAFILLQRAQRQLDLPYWVQGGIGPHTAAAARLAGAQGVVLNEQLWLTRESPFGQEQQQVWRRMDGGETETLADGDRVSRLCPARYLRGQTAASDFALGQEIAFAAWHADHFGTTGRILSAYNDILAESVELASKQASLAADAPLATDNGTRYPITQGPMARVSDAPDFVVSIAKSGALAFLGLSSLPAPICAELMQETAEKIGDRSWGVGLLGFLKDIYPRQLEEVKKIRPPYALISGGTPAQARELDDLGILTYLHVPSQRLLDTCLKRGVTRFVFEGGECGGHIGPRSSFTLWEQMIERLLDTPIDKPEQVHVLFAGGIHDELSAAMVAVLSARLVEKGIRCGVQMGSAYLLTEEAVAHGAITPIYQQKALASDSTIVLDSGLGHVNRVLNTQFATDFNQLKRELQAKGLPPKTVRDELENRNIGKLALASKGITLKFPPEGVEGGPQIIEMDAETQSSQGMFTIGEATIFHDRVFTSEALHQRIAAGGIERVRAFARQIRPRKTARRPQPGRDIAIIGMACIYPGAPNAHRYWANIIHGLDLVTEVSKERWDPADFYNPDRRLADHVYSKWGGFIDDYPIDSRLYGIPPNSMRSVEPVQLLALETARLALEDAGIDHLDVSRKNTAVVYGVGGMQDLGIDYIFRSMLTHYMPRVSGLSNEQRESIIRQLWENELPEWNEDSFPGVLNNVVAGRIANRLDLNGSNYSVDAACGSSLAALDVAMQKLRAGTADMALVGAADGTNNATSYMAFSKVQALSPGGRSRPFAETADGIAISEGMATVVLKRLEDAERDGDHIYSVIKGIGASSDGRNRSLTAPHPRGQVLAVSRAYEDADISPQSVELIEAHGTGTSVGDKSEAEALALAFGETDRSGRYCALGSVKSMIGHTKVAAGMAGLIKSAYALNQKILPPTIGVDKPNPGVAREGTPFYINTEPRPWLRNEKATPRRCGISAFGFGGTNFHTVLEEYTGDYRASEQRALLPRDAELMTFQRESREELVAALEALQQQFSFPDHVELSQLAYSHFLAEKARQAPRDGCRLALVAADSGAMLDLIARAVSLLKTPDAEVAAPGLFFSESADDPGRIAFLFPGQGAQKVNMMREILLSSTDHYDHLETANRLLRNELDAPLSEYIYPIPVFSAEERAANRDRLNDTQVAQPALAVMDMIAFDMLKKFGLRPDVVGGHSFGEYAALTAAGVLSREDLYQLAAKRGRFSKDVKAAGVGTMAAVQAGAERVRQQIEALELEVSVANINTPAQTVVAGAAAAIEQAVAKLKAAGIQASVIPVTAPFHTELMGEASDKLLAELEQVELGKADCVVYSNTLGAPYPDDRGELQAILGRHIAQPVRYLEQIEHMYAAGVRTFIEAGPGNIQSGLVNKILDGRPHRSLQFNGAASVPWTQVASLLGECWAAGYAVDIAQWFSHRALNDTSLDELAEAMNTRANPGPLIWRVNGDRALPWNEQPVKKPETRPEPGIQNQPQTTTVRETNMNRIDEQLLNQAPVEAEPEAAVSPQTTDLIQQNIAQFIELQREQQHAMDRFLSIQERLMGQVAGQTVSAPALPVRPSAPVPAPMARPAAAPHRPMPVAPAIPGSSPAAPAATPVAAVAPAAAPAANASPASGGNGSQAPQQAQSGSNGHDKPNGDFKATLLTAVSERTGYPVDMLDMDANLEADLGIDSIKRAEIFSSLGEHQDLLQGVSEETLLEELAGLQTLNKIVDWYHQNEEKSGGGDGAAKKH